MKKVAFITLGCKVNQYETNAMSQKFIEKGYEVVEHTKKADIYVINTCTVTNMSDRKSRQMLRRVKELNEKAIVVACGCYVQVAKEELEKIEEVDLILGNTEKKNIVEFVEKFIEEIQNEKNKKKKELKENEKRKETKKIKKIEKVEAVMEQKDFLEFGNVIYTEKTRAVIKVQDGCDRFCSYCIIPYARGRVRSRKPENIISEIEKISKEGIKEVVITGIHIASYGKDFKNIEKKEEAGKEYRLIDLLEEINKIEGIERIELGSLEPLLITEEFVKRLVKLKKICHHFHLSLQSGCNETLKRMNRRYSVEEFRKIVKLLRENYEDVNLTTDIIVGFPGETEKEFEETYRFLKQMKFYKMHVFKYSQRKGTKAAVMKGQIDGKKKEERSKKLIELSDENEKEYNKKYVGKEVEILWEEEKDGYYKGHTKNYILALLEKNNKENKSELEKSELDKSEKLENKITKSRCIEAGKDYILVEL